MRYDLSRSLRIAGAVPILVYHAAVGRGLSMPSLEVFLLGPPRIRHGGREVAVDTRKAVALLTYLALTPQPQRRDTLAALLWPEYAQTNARAALRRTLSTLSHALSDTHLTISRETVR